MFKPVGRLHRQLYWSWQQSWTLSEIIYFYEASRSFKQYKCNSMSVISTDNHYYIIYRDKTCTWHMYVQDVSSESCLGERYQTSPKNEPDVISQTWWTISCPHKVQIGYNAIDWNQSILWQKHIFMIHSKI